MDILSDITGALSNGVLKQIFSAQARSYWAYLICSAIFAIGILAVERRTRVQLPAHLRSFGRASWLSRSAINDYATILLNALLFSLLLDTLFPNILSWAQAIAGVLPTLAIKSAWWAPWLLAFCLFVVDDFIRFVGHYLEHRLPFLWELHKVHHSARVLNFLTAERHHPLSLLYFGLLMSVALILTNTVFLAIFAEKISAIYWLGGNIFWVVSNFLGSSLRHSSVWFSFGPRLERWLISPAQHQIHHSDDPKHFDRNFGGTLAIWDRLFGTLYTTGRKREIITYGLGDETRDYDSLYALYAVPIAKAAKQLGWRSAATPAHQEV
jgi:sterol desaturase/sphingolipid hydroxylase (fatty acid hydroxylase superfamily)